MISALSGSAVKSAFTLVTGSILARLAGSEPYGIVASAMSISGFSRVLLDSGSSAYVVAHGDLSERDASVIHRNLMIASVPTALIACIIAYFSGGGTSPYGELMRVMVAAGIVLTQVAQIVPSSWLQRAHKYQWVEWSSTGAFLASTLLVILPLAFFHQGMLAVALNQPLQGSILALLLIRFAALPKGNRGPTPISPKYRINAVSFNASDYLSNNLDVMLLGIYLGAANLGVYSRALFIAGLPATFMMSVLHASVLSRSRERKDVVGKLKVVIEPILLITVASAVFAIPALFHIDLLSLVLGPKFALSPQQFLFTLVGQWCFYASAPLASFVFSIKKQGWLAATLLVHAAFLLTAIFVIRPTTLDAAMRLYAVNGILRAVIVLLTTWHCFRLQAIEGPEESPDASAEDEPVGDVEVSSTTQGS